MQCGDEDIILTNYADIKLLNLIVNNINDIIAIFYQDGWCQYISPSVTKVLGYSAKELIGISIYKVLHPDYVKSVKQLYGQAVKGKKIRRTRFECQIRCKDGRYIWMQSEISRIFDKKGSFLKSLVVSRDITEQKRLEEIRREAEKRKRYFEEAVVSSVGMILDEEGRHIEIFGQNKKLLAKPKEEMKGFMLHQLYHARDADFILDKIRRAVRTGECQQGIYQLEIHGGKRLIEGRSVPLTYLVNGKRTVASVFCDVTEEQTVKKNWNLL